VTSHQTGHLYTHTVPSYVLAGSHGNCRWAISRTAFRAIVGTLAEWRWASAAHLKP